MRFVSHAVWLIKFFFNISRLSLLPWCQYIWHWFYKILHPRFREWDGSFWNRQAITSWYEPKLQFCYIYSKFKLVLRYLVVAVNFVLCASKKDSLNYHILKQTNEQTNSTYVMKMSYINVFNINLFLRIMWQSWAGS